MTRPSRSSTLQSRTRRIAAECVGMRARMLDRAITAAFNAEFEDLGVKLSQLNVLVAIARMEPAPALDVASALHLEASTLSRNADRLRAAGYLDSERAEDGRSRLYVLTDAGAELLERAYGPWKRAQTRAEAMLGEDGVDALRRFAGERPFDRS